MTRSSVPLRAAEWIVQFLNNHEEFSKKKSRREAEHVADLNLLTIKELKSIAKEIKKRTISATRPGDVIDSTLPYYGSRKDEWVSYVANAFASSRIIDMMTAPQIDAVPVAESFDSVSPGSEIRNLSRWKARARKRMRENAKRMRENPSVTAEAANAESKTGHAVGIPPKLTTTQLGSSSSPMVNSVAVTDSVGKAKQRSTFESPPSEDNLKKTPGKKSHSKQKDNNSSIKVDRVMARRLHRQFIDDSFLGVGSNQEHIPYSCRPPVAAATAASTFASASYTNGHRDHSSLRRPAGMDAASAFAAPNGVSLDGAGAKRPHFTASPSSHKCTLKINIKTEPKSSSQLSTFDDSIQPRDYRESAVLESLRNMGFTDVREMLAGIRATSTDAEGECVFIPHQWSCQQQAEAAMMWIVNQREEAAEARKLDEARVSSEMAERAMKQSRFEENERRLKDADLKDLYGSLEVGSRDVTSYYFPCSVLLKSDEVRKILHAIGCGLGKDEGIRLLQLEVKAKRWYGTVLPFAYFNYVVRPRFEKWSKKFISSSKELDSSSLSLLIKNVANESKKLEKGMYNLSEQQMGSFGMVPKLFLLAQTDAEANGKSLGNPTSNDDVDDEVELVSAADISRCSTSLQRFTKSKREQVVDLIDLC